MPRSTRIWASQKRPILHLAMTGIVTAAMIDVIRSGSDMRATPPSLRISAGTRSRAMTAHAPASCAMRACSAVTTSMMTPPFSIWASPAFTLKEPFIEPSPLPEPLRSATFGILRAPPALRATPHEGEGSGLEALQNECALTCILVVREQSVPVEPGQHVHLLEHVEQRGHRPPGQVRVGGSAGLLATRVELADEQERFDGRKRDPDVADRAVALLS